MKFSFAALTAIILTSSTNAFTAQGPSAASGRTDTKLFLEPSALTEYMTQAHADKLKAIQEVEAKKNAEIEVNKIEKPLSESKLRSFDILIFFCLLNNFIGFENRNGTDETTGIARSSISTC
jgi:hypothetical protein